MSFKNAIQNKSYENLKSLLSCQPDHSEIRDIVNDGVSLDDMELLEFLATFNIYPDAKYIFPDVLNYDFDVINWVLDHEIISSNDIYSYIRTNINFDLVELLFNRNAYPDDDIAEEYLTEAFKNNRFDIVDTIIKNNRINVDLVKLTYELNDDQKGFLINLLSDVNTDIKVEYMPNISLVTYDITNKNFGCDMSYIKDSNDHQVFDKVIDALILN
jgi:hypothetical protein